MWTGDTISTNSHNSLTKADDTSLTIKSLFVSAFIEAHGRVTAISALHASVSAVKVNIVRRQ